jgi:hypothetical protein
MRANPARDTPRDPSINAPAPGGRLSGRALGTPRLATAQSLQDSRPERNITLPGIVMCRSLVHVARGSLIWYPRLELGRSPVFGATRLRGIQVKRFVG